MKLRTAVTNSVKLLNHAEQFLLAYVSLSLAILVVFAAIGRRFGFSGLFWLEEFSRHALIFITFLAASAAVKYRSHPAMTTLETRLADWKKHLLIGLRSSACFLFFVWLDYYAWSHVFRLQRLEVRTSTTGMPLYFIYVPIAVFCIGIFMRYLLDAVREFQAVAKAREKRGAATNDRRI